jgi:hypothetical protein
MPGTVRPVFDRDAGNIAHPAWRRIKPSRKWRALWRKIKGGHNAKVTETVAGAEEGRWFERNQGHLLKLFEQAASEGSLRVGGKSIGITFSKRTGARRRSCCGFLVTI